MRLNLSYKPKYNIGDTRSIHKFLWFPKILRQNSQPFNKQLIWLETVKVFQMFEYGIFINHWRDLSYEDDKRR